MTQLLQPGRHPDADQLNAFAEHALPPHEQEQTLAHLAACADCRAIVFLAQPERLGNAMAPKPTAARKPWFLGWKLGPPAAFAVACLVAVTVHLRDVSVGRGAAKVDKTAHLEQSPPPQPTDSTPSATAPSLIPAPLEKSRPITLAAPAAPEDKSRYASTALGAALPLNGNNFTAGLGGLSAPKTPAGSALDGQPRQTPSGTSFLAIAPPPAAAVPAGQPALQAGLGNVGALHHELRSSASQYNSAAVTAQNNLNQPTQTAPPPSAVPAAGLPSVNETVAVSNASPLLGTESSASSQMLAGAATASLAAPALKAQKMASLPSHLLALSTISNSHQELALDSAGSLFRSEDAGVTWQTVPAQWTGHAVKLRLAPQPIMHAMAKSADSATATAKLPPAAANFELTNDVGEVWVSADGKSWQRK